MYREIRKHGLALPLTGFMISLAEESLGARLVQVIPKVKAAGNPAGEPAFAAADRPSGEDLGECRDIGLRVAARYAEGMQLENLAREVFIDAEFAFRLVRVVERLGERLGREGRTADDKRPALGDSAISESLPTEY